jgi:hypothetical protein
MQFNLRNASGSEGLSLVVYKNQGRGLSAVLMMPRESREFTDLPDNEIDINILAVSAAF